MGVDAVLTLPVLSGQSTGRFGALVRVASCIVAIGAAVLFVAIAGAAPGSAQVGGLDQLLRSSPSDSRASFQDGNAVLCAQVGFPDDDRLGALRNNSASDANVSGAAAPNSGTIHTGQGEEVNITVTNQNVVVDAVVVKGGNGYNVYPNPAAPPPILPPALPPPQHYIAPFNGGGNVPALSHWFVCYHLTTPPLAGSLTVRKAVIPPSFPPATPPPASFTAVVNCDDDVHTNVPVTFGAGGGRAAGSTITDIAPGTVCTVMEQNTASFPPGSAVSYTPPAAATTGVTIGANTGVTVTITNDFSDLAPQTGNVRVVKTVLPAAPDVTVPASYTAQVVCDDGTDANITMPGTGGTGTPEIRVAADALCAVGEDVAPLPAGMVVIYGVDGEPPSGGPVVFNVGSGATVTVTILNDPTAVAGVTTVPPTATPTTAPPSPQPTAAPPVPEPVPPSTGTLPATGASTDTPLALGVLLVAVGLIGIGYAVRRRPTP
jgi:LPXTG-motif cell wall-anchored protein